MGYLLLRKEFGGRAKGNFALLLFRRRRCSCTFLTWRPFRANRGAHFDVYEVLSARWMGVKICVLIV